MIDPGTLLGGVKLLMATKDAAKIAKGLDGDKDLIKEVLSQLTGEKPSAQDCKTFTTMMTQVAEKATGEDAASVSPTSLARTLIGGPWAIIADAVSAVSRNIGAVVAQNIRNTADALAEGESGILTYMAPGQEERWGKTAAKRVMQAYITAKKAKNENKANWIEGSTKTLADFIDKVSGAARTGKMLEAAKGADVSGKVYDWIGREQRARNAASHLGGK